MQDPCATEARRAFSSSGRFRAAVAQPRGASRRDAFLPHHVALDPSSVSNSWRKILKCTGISNVRWHDQGHTGRLGGAVVRTAFRHAGTERVAAGRDSGPPLTTAVVRQ